MTTVISIFVYLLCSVGGLTLVKVGQDHNQAALHSQYFQLSLSYVTLLGLVMYVFSFLMWIVIVQKYNLSYIQPITTGLSYIFIIAMSIFVLKETIIRTQWIGIVFILIGVLLMNIKPS